MEITRTSHDGRNEMFDASAEYYDLIYGPLKDYRREAVQIAALLRAQHPNCRTVLDVACGTGEHARGLAAEGFTVDGLDVNPAFVRIAQAKHPGGRFVEGDMRSFHLPDRYDAVLSLFSAIGYARTNEELEATLRCLHDHLMPGGVVLVEPWFPPGVLDPARVTQNDGASRTTRVHRECRVEVESGISRLHFDFEITDASGTHRFSEVHELGLFTRDQMLEAFQRAGLDASHDADGLTGRGLYVARALT